MTRDEWLQKLLEVEYKNSIEPTAQCRHRAELIYDTVIEPYLSHLVQELTDVYRWVDEGGRG